MQPSVGEEENNILQEAFKGVENNERADSGMDEDVQSIRSPDIGENIDSDEEVIQKRPKKKVRHVLDDDDSEGSRDTTSTDKQAENTSKTKTKFTAEEVLNAILDAKSDDVHFSPQTSGRRRSKIKPVLEDSSDESNDDDKINLSSLRENASDTKKACKLNDLFDAEESDEDEGKDAVQQDMDDNEDNSFEREDKPVGLKGDLFDAESSSDEDSRSSGSSCGLGMLNDNNDDDDDDEGFDESAISPHLLAKLKQGAAKKDKTRPKRKSAQRAEAMNIHSETQRLIRESQVALPYHQPAPRSLQDFLDRANRKQQEYRALRGARDLVKAKVLEDVLAKNRLSSKPSPVLNKHSLQTDHTTSDNTEKQEVDLSSDKSKAQSVLDNSLRSGSDITGTSIDNNISSDNTSGGGISNNAGSGSDNMNGIVTGDQQQNGDMNDTLPDINVACSVSYSRRVDMRTKTTDSLLTKGISELQDDSIYPGYETFMSFTDKKIMDSNKNCVEALEPMSCSISNAANSNIEQEQGNDGVRTDSKNLIHVKTKEGPVILHEVSNCSLSQLNSDTNQLNLSKKTAVNQSTFLTPKIAALVSLDFKLTPQLSGNSDSFINLDGKKETLTPVNPGVAKLMSRLFQHSTKKEKKHYKDVDISVVQKEKSVDQKEELTLNTFTYHVDEVEENPLIKLDTPGAKLMVLKEQLQVKMKQRREEARQKRQELYDIDNEEGYEGEKEEEEDEAEMTDESDTDVEEDEYDEEFGEEEEEEMQEDEAKEKNPFADDEAEEDDEADDFEDEDDMELKLDVDDEDEDNDKDRPEASDEELKNSEDEGPIKRSSTGKKKSIALCISDEEDTKDILTEDIFKAPMEKHEVRHFPLGGNHAYSGSSDNSTQLQSGQWSFRLSMPIEDSQDLYGGSLQLLEPTQTQKTQDTDQGFKFILDDSQSQLDSDGFLKNRSTVKKPVKPLMEDFSNTQDNMEQLLGLCSGQFAVTQPGENEKSSRKFFFEDSAEKALDGNMDELLGLCSGVFPNSNSQVESSQKKGVKRKASRGEEEDMESNNSFALILDNEQASDNEEEGFSDENKEAEEERDGEEVDSGRDEVDGEIERKEQQSDDVKQAKKQKFHGFTYGKQHGKIRKEFLEMEAELSGSEYDSDENLDLAEEEDILELEEGDKDVEAMDEDAIRNQVGRVHLKQLIDEDKRELMKFQEMYLPDGDLYSEGGGRLRRFRWSNMDDDTQQDMFGGESDGENVEEDNENEFKWRKERFEREKFLLEQQEKEQDKDEKSQFLKLGRVFLKKKGSVDGSVGKADPRLQSAFSDRKPPETPTSLLKLENQKKGSFLSRSKQSLAKIAEMTKPASNPLAGPKNSRNFIFQVISPDNEAQKTKKPAPAEQKKPSQISRQPAVKRPKMEAQKSFSQSSIFNHF